MKKPLESLVKFAKTIAAMGTWNGQGMTPYFQQCKHFDQGEGVLLIYSRDTGYHTSGLWKNPDYERCFHLSLSFVDTQTRERCPRNARLTKELIDSFFGRNKKLIWSEPPYTQDGKSNDVWHYRLFCDAGWQPIKPRGEVYGRELIEAGWKSWSDVQDQLEAERKLTAEMLLNRAATRDEIKDALAGFSPEYLASCGIV